MTVSAADPRMMDAIISEARVSGILVGIELLPGGEYEIAVRVSAEGKRRIRSLLRAGAENLRRIDRAHVVLRAFAQTFSGTEYVDDDDHVVMCDLIANLMHYANLRESIAELGDHGDFDFSRILANARMHFETELADARR